MSTRAMSWAIEAGAQARLSTPERAMLMVLAHRHHDRTNACFPAVETLAKAVGVSERRAQIILRAIEQTGLITIAKRTVHGRQRSNQYDLFGKPRREAHSTPRGALRGEELSTPRPSRGVTLASPDREESYREASDGNVIALGGRRHA